MCYWWFLSTTTYITSPLVECTIPIGYAREEKYVQLMQNSLYHNRESSFKVKYQAYPYVYNVYPTQALRTSVGIEVKAYVSDLPKIKVNRN